MTTREKQLEAVLREIAACDGGKGHMPELAQRALDSVGGAKFAAAVEALPDPGTNVLASAVPRTPEALHCPFCGGPR